MTLEEIIAELRVRGTQSVPFTGKALGDLQRGASYQAAKDGTLGVDVFGLVENYGPRASLSPAS